MAKRKPDKVEIWLRRLRDAADGDCEQQLQETVVAGLAEDSSIVVAQAATLVADREIEVSGDLLVEIYRRFEALGADGDKGCRAKLAIVEALTQRGHEAAEFFIERMTYVQMEFAYPDTVDTAAHLRGACAFGLVRCQLLPWTAVMSHLVDLLNDRDPVARIHAASAIAHLGSPAATPVLLSLIHI